MSYKIFYSWHSDLIEKHNRYFIWEALKEVKKSLKKDWELTGERELELSRGGAEGFAGAVDIADAIFRKIRDADFFIADVTVINSPEIGGRATPNPNVLIELGFATAVLGWEKILLVINMAYTIPEKLPFDIRNRGLITYYLPEEKDSEKTKIRRGLEGSLKSAIAEVLKKFGDTTNEAEVVPIIPEYIANAVSDLNKTNPIERQNAINILSNIDDPAAKAALVEALKHPIKDVRFMAALALTESGDPIALDKLFNMLVDPSQKQKDRIDAANHIGKMGSTRAEAFEVLDRALKRDDPEIQKMAIQGLQIVGTLEAANQLANATRDRTWTVREAATIALSTLLKEGVFSQLSLKNGIVGDAVTNNIILALIGMLEDTAAGTRVIAAEALKMFPVDSVKNRLAQWSKSPSNPEIRK